MAATRDVAQKLLRTFPASEFKRPQGVKVADREEQVRGSIRKVRAVDLRNHTSVLKDLGIEPVWDKSHVQNRWSCPGVLAGDWLSQVENAREVASTAAATRG